MRANDDHEVAPVVLALAADAGRQLAAFKQGWICNHWQWTKTSQSLYKRYYGFEGYARGLGARPLVLWIGLTKQLWRNLIEFVTAAAKPSHQFAGLLSWDVVLVGEVVNAAGLVGLTPPDADPLRPLRHARVPRPESLARNV
jgi:hypothetical protein